MTIGQTIRLPNNLWSGWDTGTSICRVEAWVDSLPSTSGKRKRGGPAYIVRTLEDDHCYPFGPSALAKAAKEGRALALAEQHAAAAKSAAAVRGAASSSMLTQRAPSMGQSSQTSATSAVAPQSADVPEEVEVDVELDAMHDPSALLVTAASDSEDEAASAELECEVDVEAELLGVDDNLLVPSPVPVAAQVVGALSPLF